MRITGTFLDEISYDIPHQNWGPKEWEADFQAMKACGIDTVILIRCGLRRFIACDSKVLIDKFGCYAPPIDLVELFLTLADKYNMAFYFGTYDLGGVHDDAMVKLAREINFPLCEEVWKKYSHHPSFKGWYLSLEFSRRNDKMTAFQHDLGCHVKALSGNLPTMVSPYIDGCKAVPNDGPLTKDHGITVEEHYKEWDNILANMEGALDAIAFQDGHIEYDEMAEFLAANKELAVKHGMQSWTNCETFDRDMPIRFLPIKWEKMLLKLNAAEKAGLDKAITFEFSHFMSPNSMYLSAHHLYNRYMEYIQK